MKEIIIETCGGLGDNLQKSTIPRMLTEAGYSVYVNYSHNNGWIHTEDIKRIVWEMNPYVRGFTDREPLVRAGGPPNVNDDFIKNWESYYDLEPKNSYPEIYYKPNKVEGISVIFDLSWLSCSYVPETVKLMAESLLEEYKNLDCKQISSIYQYNNVELDIEKVWCDSIYDMVDVLYSAGVVITLSSGPHMLAAAIHKGAISQYCILPDRFPEFPHYILPNIKYKYPNGSSR